MKEEITNARDPIPKGMKRRVLMTTNGQRKRGITMMFATMTAEQYALVEHHTWKLIYRWGGPDKPKFAAETKIDGKRVSLHRFAIGLHDERGDGLFVLPKDGDALHVWPDNLEVLTKDQLSEQRAKKAGERGNLNEEQQEWLEAECKRTRRSRWQVLGGLIQEKIDGVKVGDEPKQEPEASDPRHELGTDTHAPETSELNPFE